MLTFRLRDYFVGARHALRPVDGNRADERLSALVHMNMLNPHQLRAAAP